MRDDEGTVTVFSLFLLLIFAMVMGMAIDVTIAQYEQARLQATADRAALAAADIDQSIGAKDVVESYFEVAGLKEHLDGVELPAGSNGPSQRRVKVKTSREIPTAFMHLLDLDVLTVAANSEARDAYSSVEVSLVLDISGSMRDKANGTPRIELLKPAAKDFVTRVLEADDTGKITISLVPYAGQVNPGRRLFELLGGERRHTESSCIEVSGADFDDLNLPDTSTEQVPHFMNWTIAWEFMDWGWCPKDGTAILPLSDDPAGLKAAIDGMRLHDGTGTAYAVKWGLALLDPSSRDTIATLREEGLVGPVSEGRPADYDDDVRKIVVLMTDGKITEQVRPIYTTGVLWTNRAGSSTGVDPVVEFVEGASTSPAGALNALANVRKALNDYKGNKNAKEVQLSSPLGNLVTHSDHSDLDTIKELTERFETFEANHSVTWYFDRIPNPAAGAAVTASKAGKNLSAAEIMTALGFAYINHAVYNGEAGEELQDQRNHRNKGATADFRMQMTSSTTNVSRFEKLCDAGKEAGVEIYTIAFMAPDDAKQQMKYCASAESTHYFEVNGTGKSLGDVFSEIAASIARLRLTL